MVEKLYTSKDNIELDEVELYLNILKANNYEKINDMSSEEISKMINETFNVSSTKEQVFLIHEPVIINNI